MSSPSILLALCLCFLSATSARRPPSSTTSNSTFYYGTFFSGDGLLQSKVVQTYPYLGNATTLCIGNPSISYGFYLPYYSSLVFYESAPQGYLSFHIYSIPPPPSNSSSIPSCDNYFEKKIPSPSIISANYGVTPAVFFDAPPFSWANVSLIFYSFFYLSYFQSIVIIYANVRLIIFVV